MLREVGVSSLGVSQATTPPIERLDYGVQWRIFAVVK